MQHATDPRHDEQIEDSPWDDIDRELSGSTREVCLGYGSWAHAQAVIQSVRSTSKAPAGPPRGRRR